MCFQGRYRIERVSSRGNTSQSCALVTGGGGGLGAAVGMALGLRGVDVILVDLDLERATKVAEDVRSATGMRTLPIGADITDPNEIERAWEEALDFGPVDILINGAGAFASTEFLNISIEQWKNTLNLQLTAPFLLCQLAAREWLDRGSSGAIVNVASTAAVRAKETRGSADYSASKAGLLGLTTYLAVAFGHHGIRSNAVLPHSFTSPMNIARLADPEEEARSRESVPLKRIASAVDVASTIVFLALDGTYLNGVMLPCDGGLSRKMP